MFHILLITPTLSPEEQDANLDLQQIEITTDMPQKPVSGTTTIGEFPSLALAKQHLIDLYGHLRETSRNGRPFEPWHANTVLICKPGKLNPLTRSYTENLIRSQLGTKIKTIQTKDDIVSITAEAVRLMADRGDSPHPDVQNIIAAIQKRDEKQ